ncbi:NUDIX hydrolase [Candidatus Saccharibacteria bacterium]|nr:NUDIX hydrolase [Candidatus Saccharibacteria bacterium]MCL1963000.1 NUDIX hydrolase [Candidatus Saccharibacteria bacterium]
MRHKTERGEDLFEVSCRAVIFNPDHTKVFLREYDDHSFNIPGGHFEYGESLDSALRRELHEEIGVEYTGELIHADFIIYHVERFGIEDKINLIFVCEMPDDTEFVFDPSESRFVIGQRWVPVEEIIKPEFRIYEGIKKVIARYSESEEKWAKF